MGLVFNQTFMDQIVKKKTSPKDVFLQLAVIAALYFAAGAFITLLFQLINIWLPDVLNDGYYYGMGRPYLGALRFALATLIVVYPVLLVLARALAKSYKEDSEKHESRLRKWLVYFTLFLAASIMLGDLISLVWNFLGGELTLRFVLKSLAMLLVLGTIFAYYRWDLKRENAEGSAKMFFWILSAVVVAGMVTGFIYTGSPQEERQYQFDSQRTNDLQSAQWEIINYWQLKEKLPTGLTELNDSVKGFVMPVDPETGAAYEYTVKSSNVFELCATFNLETPQLVGRPADVGVNDNWQHAAGRVCFERTIDPELYPFLKD